MQRRQILSTLVSIAVFVSVSACGGADSPPPTPIPADAQPSGFAQWRVEDILGAFRAAGLRAEVIEPASKDERDGLATLIRVEAVRFRIAAADEATGMILCFARPDDLRWMQDYY